MHKITSLELLRTPETDFHEFEFFADKVILELKYTKTLLQSFQNTNSVFSATKQIKECEATDAQKLLSQSEKLLNVILRAKHTT